MLNIFSLTEIIQISSFVCEFNKGKEMSYLDDMKLMMMKNLNGIYATFCRIQPPNRGYTRQNVVDKNIMPI